MFRHVLLSGVVLAVCVVAGVRPLWASTSWFPCGPPRPGNVVGALVGLQMEALVGLYGVEAHKGTKP